MDKKTCKHTGDYCELTPGLETHEELALKPRTKDQLRGLIASASKVHKKYYHQLTEEQKRTVTDQWNDYNPNACEEICYEIFGRDPWEN